MSLGWVMYSNNKEGSARERVAERQSELTELIGSTEAWNICTKNPQKDKYVFTGIKLLGSLTEGLTNWSIKCCVHFAVFPLANIFLMLLCVLESVLSKTIKNKGTRSKQMKAVAQIWEWSRGYRHDVRAFWMHDAFCSWKILLPKVRKEMHIYVACIHGCP